MVRRVVTGFDSLGRSVVIEDGVPPQSIDMGSLAVSEILWCEQTSRVLDAPLDRSSPGFPLEPPAGGMSVRVIRMPGADPTLPVEDTWLRIDGDEEAVPGMHATDTLDLMVVLAGSVILGLRDGEQMLSAGDHLVQSRTPHRWRAADDQGWTYLVAMLRSDRAAEEPFTAVESVSGREWTFESPEDGVVFHSVELTPAMDLVDSSWHTASGLDVAVVVSGRVGLELPDDAVDLEQGDVVVRRGTRHRWRVFAGETARVTTVRLDAGRQIMV